MPTPLTDNMRDILALTKAGRVGAATALIRQSLGGGPDGATTGSQSETASHGSHITFSGAKTAEPQENGSRQRDARSGTSARHRHSSPGGTLDYLLYLPTTISASPPLVIMLHGCTQSAEDFARGTQMNAVAEEFGVIVAYPEQTQSANQQKCWNWFRPGDQKRASGEPALIAGIVADIIAAHGADHSRVYVAGLSAGGAAAAIMASAYPDVFAAAGVHSGLACGSASDVPSAFAAMKGKARRRAGNSSGFVPVITFHGDRDKTVHPDNSAQIHAALAGSPQLRGLRRIEEDKSGKGGRKARRIALVDSTGRSFSEDWQISGAGHAWSGGSPKGSYADPMGPDASREMLRFFLQHRRKG